MEKAIPESLGVSSERLIRIANRMQWYVDEGKLAGVVTLVSRRGKLVYLDQFGMRDLEAGKAMQCDTIFRIYSMTKPVTSVALLMLYERGLFQLRDPVSNFIPQFKDLKVYVDGGELANLEREITILDLLRHTAGFTYGFYSDTPVDGMVRQADLWATGNTNREFLRRVMNLPLYSQPGRSFHYSLAMGLVGATIELISGRTLGDFLKENIFNPLGMEDTSFTVPPQKAERFAKLYGRSENGSLEVLGEDVGGDYFNTRLEYGGGGLVSTAADYLRFAQMLLQKGEIEGTRLLGRKTVDLMTANHLPPQILPMELSMGPVPGLGFGLGCGVTMDPVQLGIMGSKGSYGWPGAAETDFWVDPQEQLIGILLTQYMPRGTYPVANDFRTLVYQALVD